MDIGQGIAKQYEFNFEFENVYTEYLDRILVPISPMELCEMLKDKTKWPKPSDLPLNVTIIGETVTQLITTVSGFIMKIKKKVK